MQATHIASVTNAMAALSQQFPGEELLLALGGQEVRRWRGGVLVATHSGVAAGRQPAVQEVVAMDLSVSLPDHGGPRCSAPCRAMLSMYLPALVVAAAYVLDEMVGSSAAGVAADADAASCRHAHRVFRA